MAVHPNIAIGDRSNGLQHAGCSARGCEGRSHKPMASDTNLTMSFVRMGLLLICGGLMACSSDNGVNRFLNDASEKINSIDTRIVGAEANTSTCRPDPYAPAISDPVPLFAGRSFTYRRGERHTGKITYQPGGTFSWENKDGTKAGTGKWSSQGAKWCESFDASPHNEAVSSRCWPVVRSRGALCYGVTRLVPDLSTNPPG